MKKIVSFLFIFSISLFSSGLESKDYLMGKFDAGKDKRMSLIDKKYALKASIYIRTEVYEAFEKMVLEAQKEGISLKVISGFRSFKDQKAIWERKWKLLQGKKMTDHEKALSILRFSSMPGTSRHHWGTDIDLNSLEDKYFQSGEGKKIYEWLLKNASRFGFCQPYIAKGIERSTGYEEEKWHWSYLPLSKVFLKDYLATTRDQDISGFNGSKTALSIKMIEKYVSGINPACKE